jgi:hypothetical protein
MVPATTSTYGERPTTNAYGEQLAKRLTDIALRLGREQEGAHGRIKQTVHEFSDGVVRITHDRVHTDGLRLMLYQNVYQGQPSDNGKGWVLAYSMQHGRIQVCPADPQMLDDEKRAAWENEHGRWTTHLTTFEQRISSTRK